MDRLVELWLTQLQPQLAHLWISPDFWRTLALGLLTLLAALAVFRKPLLERLTRRGLAPRDRELFGRLLRVLPSDGDIAFIGALDFGRAFDRRRLEGLNNFYYHWDDPEYRFVDRALEEKRMELFIAVMQFLDVVRVHAAPDEAGLHSVVSGNTDPGGGLSERTREAIDTLTTAAKTVVSTHQDLVRLGNRQLG